MSTESRRFASFALVGVVGFAVDGGLLTLLVHELGFGPYISRLFSFPAAVVTTWWLNRRHTFSQSASADRGTELARYLATQSAGALSNLATYAAVIAMVEPLGRVPIIPPAIGAIVGLVVNFLGARHIVFVSRSGHPADPAVPYESSRSRQLFAPVQRRR